jgi:hypothetical protein
LLPSGFFGRNDLSSSFEAWWHFGFPVIHRHSPVPILMRATYPLRYYHQISSTLPNSIFTGKPSTSPSRGILLPSGTTLAIRNCRSTSSYFHKVADEEPQLFHYVITQKYNRAFGHSLVGPSILGTTWPSHRSSEGSKVAWPENNVLLPLCYFLK